MKYMTLIISIALIWGGVQSLYVYFKNKEAVSYSINDLYHSQPEEEWIEITNCRINFMESMFFESVMGDGLAEEIYVPLRKYSDDGSDEIVAIAQIDNNAVVNMVNFLLLQTDKQKLADFIKKNRQYVLQDSIKVKGIKQFGIDFSGEERRKMHSVYTNLSEQFIVIKSGEKPGLGFGIFLFIGLPLFILTLIRFFNK